MAVKFSGCFLSTGIVSAVVLFGSAPLAFAGGGPENVFLVVNARSESSQTIANHYVAWRDIPDRNVLHLPWTGSRQRVSVVRFRTLILEPIRLAIRQRGLGRQIDYIVYSSDFPWSVDLASDMAGGPSSNKLRPVASLTAATFLSQLVAAKSRATAALSNNWYAARAHASDRIASSQGFRSAYEWGPDGSRVTAGGMSYVLSGMLAVTSGRGTTVQESLGYLLRSVQADGSRPTGTIYFVRNGSPRSTPRHNLFALTASELNRQGINTEILTGKFPRNRKDIMGLMLGTARVPWASSGNRILPGAFCEHLTSHGGDLRTRASQTPLTEFLRYGAAGSTGTVVEPYNFPHKFPSPAMHVHYTRGCTLAESVYQSVRGPYQLLLVGDPLCRPWAVVPEIKISGLHAGQTIQGVIDIEPTGTVRGSDLKRFELFVDGRRVAACGPGERLRFDSQTVADGFHTLRVVGIESSPIETQGRTSVDVQVANRNRAVEFSVQPDDRVDATDHIVAWARCSGAERIAIMQDQRRVAEIPSAEGSIAIAAERLGRGPVRLRAEVGQPPEVCSSPVELTIE